jgi:hypothetical protein
VLERWARWRCIAGHKLDIMPWYDLQGLD